MLILWYNGVQRARHLLPTIALLSLVAGYVIHLLISLNPKIGRMILILVVLSIGLNLGPWVYVNYVSMNRLGYVTGKQDLDSYLKSNLLKWAWYPNYAITKRQILIVAVIFSVKVVRSIKEMFAKIIKK